MNLEIALQLLTLAGIGCLFLFRKYLFSYSSEKGKNLATKEDIEVITRKVESTKNEYVAEIERLKIELALLARKNDVLFDEKIRVFKKLQDTLVNFKRYCYAFLGTFDERGEFHPTLKSLKGSIGRSALVHLNKIQEISMEEFIFLSEKSVRELNNLHESCSMMPDIEEHMSELSQGDELEESAIKIYDDAMVNIDKCLQDLYQELNFPTTPSRRNIT